MVRNIPLEVIVSWPTPNYIDPERRGPAAVNVTIVFITLVSIAVFLRLYIHMFVIRWFGTGDIFIILAYLGTVAMTALEIVGYERYDWGRHIWDVPINNVSRSLYISWWYRIVYSAVACFTRMALIFFYYRITPGGSAMRVFRRWIHLVAVFSAATGLMLVFATIFQCSPIRAMWTWPPVQGARCINEGRWTFVCGIINTIADIFVVVLPIPIIYKLRLPLRKRIGAIVLVSLGFLVCIVGIVRAYFVWLSLIHSYDVTWNGYGALVAATVEIHVGLVCACAPAIRLGFIRLLKPKLTSLRSSSPYHVSTAKASNTKMSDKVSSTKASFNLKKPKRPLTANSGTFLASATRGSSDSDRDFEFPAKGMNNELRTIDDDSDDAIFGLPQNKPLPPAKDEIYLTREGRVESSPMGNGLKHTSHQQAARVQHQPAEYADATIYARRSDVVPSVFRPGAIDGRMRSHVMGPRSETDSEDLDRVDGDALNSPADIFHTAESFPEVPPSHDARRGNEFHLPNRTFNPAARRF